MKTSLFLNSALAGLMSGVAGLTAPVLATDLGHSSAEPMGEEEGCKGKNGCGGKDGCGSKKEKGEKK